MNKIHFHQHPQNTVTSQPNLRNKDWGSYSNNLGYCTDYDTFKKNSIVPCNKINFSGKSLLQDVEYHRKLAEGINKLYPDLKCKIEDLKAIIGTQELTQVLKNATPENFSVGGYDKKNVQNGIFTINLHTHTTDSDGKFSVKELLNSAAEYANRINKPVYIGITNHDTINDLVKAIKITAENKGEFKNLKIVLGIEFNAKHEDAKKFKSPLSLEMIGYCINPFDVKFNKFLNAIKRKNQQYATEIINKVNSNYGTNIDFEKAKKYDSSLRNCGAQNFLWKLKEYLTQKLTQNNKNTEYLKELFSEHLNNHGSLNITAATPEMKDIIDVMNSTSAMTGIAHPARNQLGRKINLPTKEARESQYYDVLYVFFKKFKNLGGKIIESEYQYKPKHLNHPNKIKKIEFVRKIAKELDLLPSGGLDNHEKDLFN